MSSLDRVAVSSRVFGVSAILGLVLLYRDEQLLVGLVVLAMISATAVYLSLATPLAAGVIIPTEAAVTGLIVGLALPGGVMLLPYLVVLSLVAGISRGVVGVSATVLAQSSAMIVVVATMADNSDLSEIYLALGPWALTSVGAGLLGSWFRQSVKGWGAAPHQNASYEAAHRLLSQLRTVARRLSSGLDPVTMSANVVCLVADELAAKGVAVFVKTDGGLLTPLSYSDATAQDALRPDHIDLSDAWSDMEPALFRHEVTSGLIAALPLRVGSRMIGIALAELDTPPHPAAVQSLMRLLDDQSLRLDTALTFDELRSIATNEERHRLAREIHDGIAQEVASLGYLTDDIIAAAESLEQRRSLTQLRDELTRVVNELRLSIFDLRSEVLTETGLGSALSDYVRQVGARSELTVHVTLDEAPTRLRAETEAELLRIAQEAITNARKHSGARNLWVDCVVRPPFARLEVRDDGCGLTSGRADSYGLRIMRERAERINAELEIRDRTKAGQVPRGTTMTVTVGSASARVTTGNGVSNVE